MAFQTENEALSYSLKRYPWLQDFCTYINRPEEELSKTEYYLSCAEIHWIISLASWTIVRIMQVWLNTWG